MQALAQVAATVRREAGVMAYDDAFRLLALVLAISAGVVWLAEPVRPGAGGARR